MNILGQNNFLVPNSMRGGIHVEPTLGATKSVVGNMDIWRAAARPELVANGGFDADTGWSKLGGFSIGAGKATCVQTGGNDIIAQQIPSAVDGESYTLRLEYSTASSGAFRVYFGSLSGSSSGGGVLHEETLSGDGVLEITQAWGTETWLMLFSVGTWEGTIDNVSVRLAGATKLSTSAQRIWDDVLRMLGGKPEKWGTLTAVDPSVVPCAELAPELVDPEGWEAYLTGGITFSVSAGVVSISRSGDTNGRPQQLFACNAGDKFEFTATVVGDVAVNLDGTIERFTNQTRTISCTAPDTNFSISFWPYNDGNSAVVSEISFHLATAQPGEHPLDHTAVLALMNSNLNVGAENIWRCAIGIESGVRTLAPSADAASFVGVGSPAWDARLNGTDQYFKADLTGLILAHDPGWTDVFVGGWPTGSDSYERVFNCGPSSGGDTSNGSAYVVTRITSAANFGFYRNGGTTKLFPMDLGVPTEFVGISLANGSAIWVSDVSSGSGSYDELTDLNPTQGLIGAGGDLATPNVFGDPFPHARTLLTVPLPNAELTNLAKILKAAHDAASAL